MIEFRDVHASYDSATPILKGVSFTVRDGEFVAFVGTNGAGKSTAMRLVNGLLKPDSGEVLIDGVPTAQLKTSELARRVGFLFQNPDSQICSPTVREELLFGFRATGRLDAAAEQRVDQVIDQFGFDGAADPFLLNRGTRQLLALASIVVLEPPVVVLDEPTTGLDFRECVKVMEVIRRLHERGTTVVMVCHDMEVVADFAERVVVMSAGEVVDQGPTFEVLRNRRTLERANLVPPQIVDISLALPLMNPSLNAHPVAHANTLDDMRLAVVSQAAPSRAAGMLETKHGEMPERLRAPGAQELATGQVFEIPGDEPVLAVERGMPPEADFPESPDDVTNVLAGSTGDDQADFAPEPMHVDVTAQVFKPDRGKRLFYADNELVPETEGGRL
ncbi:MAG: ABC transporter ATP-binding protein [Eggerthellaceae bacterium]|nr:ABC transporter ATP-binding protein [Eggerthellaceae bacterium]